MEMQFKVMVSQLFVPATEMSQCGHSINFCTWEVFMETLEPLSMHRRWPFLGRVINGGITLYLNEALEAVPHENELNNFLFK
jgi:hypothetical protein